jgi:ferredoxin
LIHKRKPVDPKSIISFRILPENKLVQASQDSTILEALLKADIELDHSCDGHGTCGTCRIFVEKGLEKLGPRNEVENEFASDRQFRENERLSCQCLVQEGLILKRP